MDENMLPWKSAMSPALENVVLIISDQREVSGVWETLFRQKGCAVVQETHDNALLTCKAIDPALVVIDTHLPHAKRLMFCSKIRLASSSPILLLVPDYNGSQVFDIYNAGVDECLLKPISPTFLVIKAISWLLRRRWIEYKSDTPPLHTRPC